MDDISFTPTITPYLPLLGTIAGGVVIGIFAVWNRKRGATETRAPDVNESWRRAERLERRLDTERSHRRFAEDLADKIQDAFRAYVRRVRHGGDTTMTDRERFAHDVEIPTMPSEETS